MADEPQRRYEGWHVRWPLRVALVAVLVPIVLLLTLIGMGHWFDTTIGKRTFRKPEVFPAPGLDMTITRPTRDADTPRAESSGLDPQVERAKAAVLRRGISGWSESPR